MNEQEIENALRELQDSGEIEELIDLDNGERGKFRLTEQGRTSAKELLKTNPEALATVLGLAWNALIKEVTAESDDIEKVFIVLRHVGAWEKLELEMPFEDIVTGLEFPQKYRAAKKVSS